MKELLKKYLSHLKRRDLAVNTIKNYHCVIRSYFEKVKSLTTANLKAYTKISLKKLSPTTCQENLNILVLYAKWCKISRIVKQSSINKEIISRIIPKFQQRFFPTINQEELELLKQARFEKNEKIWQRNNLMMEFLFYTGLRVSELINLRHSDWVNDSLRILGKGNKIRYVFIPEWLVDKFYAFSEEYLFVNQLKRKMLRHYINTIIQKRAKLAGIKKWLTAHSFRRSFATLLDKKRARLTTIQKLLGHARIETTANYIHNSYEELYQDYSKLWK